MATLHSLAGRTAAITGGSRGIGLAIASWFAREGAKVVLLGRDKSTLEHALGGLSGSGAVEVSSSRRERNTISHQRQEHAFFVHDVRDAKSWTEVAVAHVRLCSPNIDILVNCAGVSQSSLLVKTSPADVEDILATNLQGAIWGCKVIGRQMIAGSRRQKQSGDPSSRCIINVSSLLAHKGIVGTSVYAASKAGLLGLTTSLAQEYGAHSIRVNAIVPGYITSDMTKDAGTAELIKKIPLNRFGTPDEIADAALFLARNPYANNCILNLDGGLSAT
ncbi:hypothetical protein B0T17DRAFT_484417 [Bombardia bombarda]|uniref:Ketoreductase domain-containing protein n=1 Tax=Bombardia bombarda TaxID=252184 RepID=A0AA40CEK9_9PEZI|nr:hypothetical protein B0T17DRAFT_484417 [Bombardia bombarda]